MVIGQEGNACTPHIPRVHRVARAAQYADIGERIEVKPVQAGTRTYCVAVTLAIAVEAGDEIEARRMAAEFINKPEILSRSTALVIGTPFEIHR